MDIQLRSIRFFYKANVEDPGSAQYNRNARNQLADTNAGAKQIQAVRSQSFDPYTAKSIPCHVCGKDLTITLALLTEEMQKNEADQIPDRLI